VVSDVEEHATVPDKSFPIRDTNSLHIMAVSNLHRRPEYWEERIVPGHRVESDE
jgi:hypothetical protein